MGWRWCHWAFIASKLAPRCGMAVRNYDALARSCPHELHAAHALVASCCWHDEATEAAPLTFEALARQQQDQLAATDTVAAGD